MQRSFLALATVSFVSALTSTFASATAQRTFVASTGSDANPCSIAAPCRGFARAITQTVSGGEVIVVDSAGYGPVTITKSVSVIAPPGIYAGISVPSGDGVTVNAPAATVVLRGLSISGQGTGRYGIFLEAAGRLRIENCVVSGLGSDGINVTAAGAELIATDTIVRDNGGTGIGVGADLPSISLDHVRSEHNAVDGFHLAPTPGSLGAIATVADSVFTHNGVNGIGADTLSGATTTITAERSVLASNGGDGFVIAESAGGSAVLAVSHNSIDDNGGNGISMGGNMQGTASDNVLKRNSGYGVLISDAVVGPTLITVAGNVLAANLVSGVRASGTGVQLQVSANTGFDGIQCDNNAIVSTLGNNATPAIVHSSGCFVITVGGQ